MRKNFYILSLLVVLSMILTACGGTGKIPTASLSAGFPRVVNPDRSS